MDKIEDVLLNCDRILPPPLESLTADVEATPDNLKWYDGVEVEVSICFVVSNHVVVQVWRTCVSRSSDGFGWHRTGAGVVCLVSCSP